jgi:prepilin-type processing-associated H-X9-DG protein
VTEPGQTTGQAQTAVNNTMSRCRAFRKGPRSGFSKVDLLVVTCVIVIIGAIVAPLILYAQQQSKSQECVNRMRQIATAIMNHAATNKHLPALSDSIQIRNSSGQTGDLPVGWPILLLPSMDQNRLFKSIQDSAIIEGNKTRVADREKAGLTDMTCPNDDAASGMPGRMSYVINTGFISRSHWAGDPNRKHRLGSLSWNANDIAGEPEDIKVHGATGVCWPREKQIQQSFDEISQGDGCTVTLLLTENLQAGDWFDTESVRIGFGIPVANVNSQVAFGNGALFESRDLPLNTEFDGGTLTSSLPQDWLVNTEMKADRGTRPRPSSNHPGYVNVFFCDASARVLNQKIDPHVYLMLITTNGVQYGEKSLHKRANPRK